MTTNARPAVTRETIDERWRMATTSTVFCDHAPAHPSDGNSKAMRRLMESLEYLAGRMVEDGIHEAEESGWDSFQGNLLTTVEARIKEYALDLETARAGRRTGAAA